MINTNNNQSGFSAVELLITLFIGAIFLIAGYQLYSQVVKSGTEANQDAKASSIAYELLRRNQSSSMISSTCAASSDNSPDIPDNQGLAITSASIQVTCPYSSSTAPLDSISKMTVSLTYNGGRSVQHAIFATR